MQIEILLPDRFGVGEGGFWDVKTNTLTFVDIHGHAVCRYHPATGKLDKTKTDHNVNFAVPRSNGKGFLIPNKNNKLVLLEEKTGVMTPFLSDDRIPDNAVINDAKADAKGRVWFGTMIPRAGFMEKEKWLPESGLFSVSPDGVLTKHLDDIVLSNGLDWTRDHSKLVFADTFKPAVYIMDFDVEKGTISNRRKFLEYDNESTDLPDGLCIDADDNVWIAQPLRSRVVKFDIKTGKELQIIQFPYPIAITCCNFGGKNFEDLYVTSTKDVGVPGVDPQPEEAGALFRVTGLGAKGKAPYTFAG